MRLKLEIIGAVVILALAGLYGYEQFQKAVQNKVAAEMALHDREADAKLDARLKQLDQADQQRQKDYEAKSAALPKLTPQQIVVKLPEYVPQAPEPIHIVSEGGPYVPGPGMKVGDAVVPQADIKPIAQALLDGNKCSGDLAACKVTQQTWQDKYATKKDEADDWQKAAKGGSVWQRVGKDILKISIGAGIGYLAARR